MEDIVFNKKLQLAVPETMGDHNIGDTVYVDKNEMIVIHKGIPDSDVYDNSFDGVWLMRKAPIGPHKWNTDHMSNSSGNGWGNAWLNNYLNNDFVWPSRHQFKTVNLPYRETSGALAYTSATTFILSAAEIGLDVAVYSSGAGTVTAGDPIDDYGITLDYFKTNAAPKGWLRTAFNGIYAWCSNGSVGGLTETLDVYICMVVPYDMAADLEGTGYEVNSYIMTKQEYLKEQYTTIVECERNLDALDTIYPALERRPFNVTSNYGITEIILSGYLKWTEEGAEKIGYFNQDITRQCQGMTDKSATFMVCGIVCATDSYLPKMFAIKMTGQAPMFVNTKIVADLGLAVNDAFISNGQDFSTATPYLLKVRTILPKYIEQI